MIWVAVAFQNSRPDWKAKIYDVIQQFNKNGWDYS